MWQELFLFGRQIIFVYNGFWQSAKKGWVRAEGGIQMLTLLTKGEGGKQIADNR